LAHLEALQSDWTTHPFADIKKKKSL
jgi:hypothetical protein